MGEDGPLAPRAGHDINYIALAGVLHAFVRRGEAPFRRSLVGDFGAAACARLRHRLRAARSPPFRQGQWYAARSRRLALAPCFGFLASKTGRRNWWAIFSTPARPGMTIRTKDAVRLDRAIETKFYESCFPA